MRRPPRYPWQERRSGDRAPPRAGARAHGRGARVARLGWAPSPGARRRAGGGARYRARPRAGPPPPGVEEGGLHGRGGHPGGCGRARPGDNQGMIVDCAVYEHGQRHDGQVNLHDAYEACRRDGAWTWIGLYEPTEQEFDSIQREFELHELAVEDAIKAHQRPKLEVYDDMLFVVLKTARYIDATEEVEFGEILVFLGNDYIITVRHGEASSLHEVRLALEHDPEQLARGPGVVLHAIMDHIVDDYLPAMRGLEIDVDQVEEEVFSGSTGG